MCAYMPLRAVQSRYVEHRLPAVYTYMYTYLYTYMYTYVEHRLPAVLKDVVLRRL